MEFPTPPPPAAGGGRAMTKLWCPLMGSPEPGPHHAATPILQRHSVYLLRARLSEARQAPSCPHGVPGARPSSDCGNTVLMLKEGEAGGARDPCCTSHRKRSFQPT